jgi:NAD(P)-dependent dehydrogenase (short-subunit alcohol dehydrogenase family)
LETARQELGPDVLAVSSNAGYLSAQIELAKTVGKEFGALDILVLNAGIVEMRPLEKWDEAAFDRNVDINFQGAIFPATLASTQCLEYLLCAGHFSCSRDNDAGRLR